MNVPFECIQPDGFLLGTILVCWSLFLFAFDGESMDFDRFSHGARLAHGGMELEEEADFFRFNILVNWTCPVIRVRNRMGA
jgi:hypothetical protein